MSWVTLTKVDGSKINFCVEKIKLFYQSDDDQAQTAVGMDGDSAVTMVVEDIETVEQRIRKALTPRF